MLQYDYRAPLVGEGPPTIPVLGLAAGTLAPGAKAGQVRLYVDSTDHLLKAVWPDGTVRVILVADE